MKTQILFIATLCFFLVIELNAQYIVTGQHSANDYYFNIPDTTIHSTCRAVPEQEFPVDLNGDGTVDFKFLLYCWDAQMDKGGYMSLRPLNGNQIIYDHTDTCSSNLKNGYIIPMAKSMSLNDTINNNYIWSSSVLFLLFKEWCPPLGYNYCNFSSNFTYAGVRLITPSDTLHGWIGFSVTPAYYDYHISIYEWACNINTHVGIAKTKISYKIYPNPSNGMFKMELGQMKSETKLELFNINGESIFRYNYPGLSKEPIVNFDCAYLKPGVYILRIINEDKTRYEKILILN